MKITLDATELANLAKDWASKTYKTHNVSVSLSNTVTCEIEVIQSEINASAGQVADTVALNALLQRNTVGTFTDSQLNMFTPLEASEPPL